MMKDRNSFQILRVLYSYQTVFPFVGCLEILCPSSTQSIFLLFSASCELVLHQNHRLNSEAGIRKYNSKGSAVIIGRLSNQPYPLPLPWWGSGRLT